VSGIMNLSRNRGGDFGIAFVTSLIARRSQIHQARLSEHTTAYDPAYQAKVNAIAGAMEHAGSTSAEAARRAVGAMYRQLVLQATQLAYLDALWIMGVGAALIVPVLAMTKRPGPMGAPAGH
jgi:DHA2 family multidrug resistance protein